MREFLKLNLFALGYAWLIVIPIELMLNTHRIQRILDKDLDFVSNNLSLLSIIWILFGSVVLYLALRKYSSNKLTDYFTGVMWLPYFIGLTYLTTRLFPMSYEGDIPSPGTGFLILFALFMYPFYILIFVYMNRKIKKRGEKI
mgnify:CR=1 FL=1